MLRQAVFLVGDRGTRLGGATRDGPKPMLPVGGRPFIAYLIDNAARHGLTDIILLAGHKADAVRAHWGETAAAAQALAQEGVRIAVVQEPKAMGTAGALWQARDMLDDVFLVANGERYFDFNWLDLLTLPAASEWQARMALRAIADTARYGTVLLDDARVQRFEAAGAAGPGLIDGGVYLVRKSAVAHLGDHPASLEQEVFPKLASEGALYGRPYDGFFIDIGIPGDLAKADATMAGIWRRPAAFLDRDGVLNVDRGYVHRAHQVEWIPGAIAAVKRLNDAGYFVFVVTNQAGVARGYYSEDDVDALHRWMAAELQRSGAHIDRFEYCPYHAEGVVDRYRIASDRRKPEAGMLLDCMARFPVDRERSFLIGDKPSDLEAARAAGVRGHLFAGSDLDAFVGSLLSS